MERQQDLRGNLWRELAAFWASCQQVSVINTCGSRRALTQPWFVTHEPHRKLNPPEHTVPRLEPTSGTRGSGRGF